MNIICIRNFQHEYLSFVVYLKNNNIELYHPEKASERPKLPKIPQLPGLRPEPRVEGLQRPPHPSWFQATHFQFASQSPSTLHTQFAAQTIFDLRSSGGHQNFSSLVNFFCFLRPCYQGPFRDLKIGKLGTIQGPFFEKIGTTF